MQVNPKSNAAARLADLVEAWGARAKQESVRLGVKVTGSEMLRHVMECALASPTIMPMRQGAWRWSMAFVTG